MNSAHVAHIFRALLAKRLRCYVSKCEGAAIAARCGLDSDKLLTDYHQRLSRYMNKADFGSHEAKRSSYLNVFTGLVAYELLCEADFTEQEAFAAYDYMSAPLRRLARVTHGWIDLLPWAFDFVSRGLVSDLTGSKRMCRTIKMVRNDHEVFECKITRCLCCDACRLRMPEFTRAFCTHDDFAYGNMGHNVKFTRCSCFGNGGNCCHDRFERMHKNAH